MSADAEHEAKKRHLDEEADEADRESFPASDAPSHWSGPDHQGRDKDE